MSQSNGVKASSVAAFLFMPQFKYSFQHFAHIVPVFMQCLAMVFLAGGMIGKNHPALRYGEPDVPRYPLRKLFGDAWFNLRATNAGPQAWCLFIGTVSMLVATASALSYLAFRLTFNIGAAAQAQIFSHPDVASVYGGTSTGFDAVRALPAPTDAATLFDKRTGQGEAAQDYALQLLDKVLRQAAVGEGGSLQMAVGSLMQVYNTAVLVIAAVMVFWMILSIVVDTAKTGIVGGGRHNMVWTPIRVIFALGLMIPLGTSGFSSGQFMVMKLAEWGSNLATRGWVEYTRNINADLLAPYRPGPAADLVIGLSRIMICQLAYNTASAANGLDRNHAIAPLGHDGTNSANSWGGRMMQRFGAGGGSFWSGEANRAYTNMTDDNLCGSLKWTVPSATRKEITLSTLTNPWCLNAATCAVSLGMRIYDYGSPVDQATHMRIVMSQAIVPMIVDRTPRAGDAGAGTVFEGCGTNCGTLINSARQFACTYVPRFFGSGPAATNPTVTAGQASDGSGGLCSVTSAQGGPCGGDLEALDENGAPAPRAPNASCLMRMNETVVNTMQNAYITASGGNVDGGVGGTDVMSNVNDQILEHAETRGWAGMGMWYHQIATMNQIVRDARQVPITVQPGTFWGAADVVGSDNRPVDPSFVESKTSEVSQSFHEWWRVAVMGPYNADPLPDDALYTQMRTTQGWSKGDKKGIEKQAEVGGSGSNWLLDHMSERVVGDPSNSTLFFDAAGMTNGSLYPMAGLTSIGYNLRDMGVAVLMITSTLQIVAGSSVFGFTALGIALSDIMGFFSAVGKIMFVSGIMLSFYVPILPLLRVAFAVLTWIISVVEAVVMVPIAALAHLTSEGDGLVGSARGVWILWLNVLLRPILVVLGFVFAALVFNGFVIYFTQVFNQGASAVVSNQSAFYELLGKLFYSVAYVAVIYTIANTSFKMLDLIPNALMRWLGGPGPDSSFDDDSSERYLIAGTNLLGGMLAAGGGGKGGGGGGGGGGGKKGGPAVTK